MRAHGCGKPLPRNGGARTRASRRRKRNLRRGNACTTSSAPLPCSHWAGSACPRHCEHAGGTATLRRLWVDAVVASALARAAARAVAHRADPDWPAAERQALVARLAPDLDAAPSFNADAGIDAGLRIAAGGNVVDGSLAGLLEDRAEVGAQLAAIPRRAAREGSVLPDETARSASGVMSRASIRSISGPVLHATASGPFKLREAVRSVRRRCWARSCGCTVTRSSCRCTRTRPDCARA